MMRYFEIRNVAHTGDVLLVEGNGFISKVIRVVTGQNISHVAVLVWFGNTLWVAEMKEFVGYRLRPASLWVDDAVKTGTVYFGTAPTVVRHANGGVGARDEIFSYRNHPYSYLSLLKVWWAQITRRKTGADLVCSTFVQRVWERCGFRFGQTADPGDYMRLCISTFAIKK